VRLRIL